MKKLSFILLLAVLASLAFGQNSDPGYAFGLLVGNSIRETGVVIDQSAFMKGLKDALENASGAMKPEEAEQIVQEAIASVSRKQGEANSAKEAEFLSTNARKKGVLTTASGLQYEILKEGTGERPKATDTVRVDYVGSFLDGSVFDSSIARGEPAEFPLSGVIPGWTEGLQLMRVGGKARFYIPSSLAYGPQGAGSLIPPNALLIFEVDLLAILPAETGDGLPE